MPITIRTNNIHTNVHFSNLAVKYSNADHIGAQIAPDFLVKRESDKYREYKRDGFFSGAPIRSDGAIAEEATLAYDEKTYTTYERALKDLVTDRSINNADSVFNLKKDSIDFLSEKIKLGREIDISEQLLATDGSGISSSNPDHVVTPTVLWNDKTSSVPEEDIATGKLAIQKQIGRKPNVLLLGPEVAKSLAEHPNIKELRKYVNTDALTQGGLPSTLWGLKVLEGSAIYNTAEEGETLVMDFVWGKNALIAYVNPRDPLTLARTFVLRSRNMKVTTWRDEEREGDWQRIVYDHVVKVICKECGYLISGAVA